jgi:hypothetical protein
MSVSARTLRNKLLADFAALQVAKGLAKQPTLSHSAAACPDLHTIDRLPGEGS